VKISADASAALLTSLLHARSAFIYARIGDGDIYCAFSLPPYGDGSGENTNGERAQPWLGERVRGSIRTIARLPMPVYFGDYLSRAPGGEGLDERWSEMLDWLHKRPMIHVEALLIHRRSLQLAQFYRDLAKDDRPKVYVSAERMTSAALALGADHLVIPESNAYEQTRSIAERIRNSSWEIVLYSAGYATKPIMAAAWSPERTQIDLGSALDPVYVGATRTGQLSKHDAGEFFSEAIAA